MTEVTQTPQATEGAEMAEPYFSAEQYGTLTYEERDALGKVAERISPESLGNPDDETLQETFNILRPCEGCLPEEEIGDDLLLDIRRKFASIYYAAIELAEEVLKKRGYVPHRDFGFCLDIDPSYEDSTHVAIVDIDHAQRPYCYFHTHEKAWHVHFEFLQDIAQSVLQTRDSILATFLRLTGGTAETGTRDHAVHENSSPIRAHGSTAQPDDTERLYRVTWVIEVGASSPAEAAEKAYAIQRNPDSIATVFAVANEKGTVTRIDLDDRTDDRPLPLTTESGDTP